MTVFVLVPGAGGDSWYWHRLVPELEARNHEAVAVDLPAGDDGAGWSEYAEAIDQAIGDRTDVVLVAQSLAGFSASLVPARRPVRLLVLVNAMIPLPGETGAEWWIRTGQADAQRRYLATIGLSPEDVEDVNVLYFHDVPTEVASEAFRRGEPAQSWTPMTQPWPLTAWPTVPTRALAGRDDRLFPVSFQQRIARQRLQIGVDLIVGGHLLALGHPRRLAEQLIAYIADVEAR
jgi:pimeloyl-ACP methyl ester carboxylesterase